MSIKITNLSLKLGLLLVGLIFGLSLLSTNSLAASYEVVRDSNGKFVTSDRNAGIALKHSWYNNNTPISQVPAPNYTNLTRCNTSSKPIDICLESGWISERRYTQSNQPIVCSNQTTSLVPLIDTGGLTQSNSNHFYNCISDGGANTPCGWAKRFLIEAKLATTDQAFVWGNPRNTQWSGQWFGHLTYTNSDTVPALRGVCAGSADRDFRYIYDSNLTNTSDLGNKFVASSHGYSTYQMSFYLSESDLTELKKSQVYLRFAMDDMGKIELNNFSRTVDNIVDASQSASSFSSDVTSYLRAGTNTIRAVVFDKITLSNRANTSQAAFLYFQLSRKLAEPPDEPDEETAPYSWSLGASAAVRCGDLSSKNGCLDRDLNLRRATASDPVRALAKFSGSAYTYATFQYDLSINRTGVDPNTYRSSTAIVYQDGVAVSQPMNIRHSSLGTSISDVVRLNKSDAGKTICRWIELTPSQFNSTTNTSPHSKVSSNKVCVYIPYNYNLPDTTVTTNTSNPAPGTAISIDNTAIDKDNQGSYPTHDATKSRLTAWSLDRFVSTSGNLSVEEVIDRLKRTYSSSSSACGYYLSNPRGVSVSDCANLRQGNLTLINNGPTNPLDSNKINFTVPADTPVGAKICFVVSVKPWFDQETTRSNQNAWFHGTPTCIVVAKYPKFQARGGSVLSQGPIIGSVSTFGGHQFGSWGEYDLLSNALISGVASNAGYLAQPFNSAYTQSLTFANTGPLGYFGGGNQLTHFSGSPNSYLSIANYFDAMTSNPTSSNLRTRDLTSAVGDGSKIIKTTSSLVIDQPLNLEIGQQLVVVAEGEINIQKPIAYTKNSLTKINDLPQLVLISRSGIKIRPDVTQVDAWLVADNASRTATVNTCDEINLSAKACTNQLVINGPVVANRIKLRRTAFSDTSKQLVKSANGSWQLVNLQPGNGAISTNGITHNNNAPAEIINFRPDAYLFGYSFASQRGIYKTNSVRELPPRY